MPEIREALVTVAATKPGLEKLFAALAPTKVNYVMPYAPDAKEKIAEYAKTADVAILNGDLDDSILAGENLKWIHCCHAGLDRSARPEVFERGIILTSSSGRSAPALAQHAMLFLEALTYELPMLFKAQREHRWAASREYAQKVGIFGRTMGIIGLGKNGMEMARLAKELESPFLQGYVRLSVDVANLRAAVRVHRMGREGDFLRQVLLPGGNVSEQAIASARGDALGEVFRAGPLAQAAELGAKLAQPGGESLTAFERECDNALTAYLAAARRVPFGEETVIGYLYAKEQEFTAIRAIFAGRAAGLDGETIRSRLRETYV